MRGSGAASPRPSYRISPDGWDTTGFLLLAMISFSLFPLFKYQLAGSPRTQQQLIAGLLIPLAIADVSVGTSIQCIVRADG